MDNRGPICTLAMMGKRNAPVVFADLPTSIMLTDKDRDHISLIQHAGSGSAARTCGARRTATAWPLGISKKASKRRPTHEHPLPLPRSSLGARPRHGNVVLPALHLRGEPSPRNHSVTTLPPSPVPPV